MRAIALVFLAFMAAPALAQEGDDAAATAAATTAGPAAESATPTPMGPAFAMQADLLTYPIGARDVLAIDVYDEKSISGTFVVGDDGNVDLPLLGRVPVSGLTTAAADDLITSKLASDFLVNPQVTVRVDAFGSKPVQVLGSVAKPGTYYLSGPTTLLDVLTMAGGVKDTAAVEVRVQRRNAQHTEPFVASLEALVAYGTGNTSLEPGDVVFVPPGPVVYVSGEVSKPGTVPYLEGLSVVQAINRAGGATDRANLRSVYVLRDGQRSRMNAKRVLKGVDKDVKLQPEDHVYVKESVF